MMTKWLIAALAILCVSTAWAVPVTPITNPHVTYVDASGLPCAGCSLYTYAAGTTTPLATYTDAAGTVQNTNPIILDAAGGANVWLGANTYKFILESPLGATIWTTDQISPWSLISWATITTGTQSGSGISQANTLPGRFAIGGVIAPNAINGLMSASHFYSPRGEYDPYAFGAVGDGSTDDTAAIRSALTAAGALGGGVVKLHAGNYKVSSSLHIPSGVYLEGSGSICDASSIGVNTGTCIYYTGTGPTLVVDASIAGEGVRFGIERLMVVGSHNADNCMSLLGSVSSAPRVYVIHDVYCTNFANDGMYITGTSYGNISHVTLEGFPGTCTNGMEFAAGGLFDEVTKISDIAQGSCTGAGVKIASTGNNLYFDKLDINDNATGIYIGGSPGPYALYFYNTNIVRSSANGVELDASTNFIGRLRFKNTNILMLGASNAEHAIYSHRSGSNTVSDSDFDFVDLSIVGATAPTTAISAGVGAGFTLENARNFTGGAISVQTANAYNFSTSVTSGGGYTADQQSGYTLGTTWLDATNGLGWHTRVDKLTSQIRLLEISAGETDINSGTGSTQINNNVATGSGTGGSQFGDGAGNVVSSIDATGKGVFNGGLLSGAPGVATQTVYRCATAGATLPVGSLTINAAACGTTVDTGLRVK